jgi:hypothetical protein
MYGQQTPLDTGASVNPFTSQPDLSRPTTSNGASLHPGPNPFSTPAASVHSGQSVGRTSTLSDVDSQFLLKRMVLVLLMRFKFGLEDDLKARDSLESK